MGVYLPILFYLYYTIFYPPCKRAKCTKFDGRFCAKRRKETLPKKRFLLFFLKTFRRRHRGFCLRRNDGWTSRPGSLFCGG